MECLAQAQDARRRVRRDQGGQDRPHARDALGRGGDLRVGSDQLDLAGSPARTSEDDDFVLLELGQLAAPVERHVIEIGDAGADAAFAANQSDNIRLDIDAAIPLRHVGGTFRLQGDAVANPHMGDQRGSLRQIDDVGIG